MLLLFGIIFLDFKGLCFICVSIERDVLSSKASHLVSRWSLHVVKDIMSFS